MDTNNRTGRIDGPSRGRERMRPSTRRQLWFIAAVLVIGWISGIALQLAGI